jgi:hypothetical protein
MLTQIIVSALKESREEFLEYALSLYMLYKISSVRAVHDAWNMSTDTSER